MRFRSTLFAAILLATAFPETGSTQTPSRKLQTIIFPSIEFSEATLDEAVGFLQSRSAEIAGSPAGGVNLILNGDEAVRNHPVTLNLRNVSLGQALWFLSEIAKLEIKIDQHAVILSKAEKWTPRPVKTSLADKAVLQKLHQIMVPGVEFSSVPLSDAVDLMRSYSSQLDTSEPNPQKRGVNFVLVPDPAREAEPEITFTLTQVPLSQVLRYTSEISDFEARIEKGAVILAPKTAPAP